MGEAKRRGSFEYRYALALEKAAVEAHKRREAELELQRQAQIRRQEQQFLLDWAEARAEDIWRTSHPGEPIPDRYLKNVAKRSVRHDHVGLVVMMGLAASSFLYAGSLHFATPKRDKHDK